MLNDATARRILCVIRTNEFKVCGDDIKWVYFALYWPYWGVAVAVYNTTVVENHGV